MTERDYTHASFFSGIGAFDLGLEQAGFRVVSHAEVKPFSCAVLETRWPGVPNLGDINTICPDGEGDHDCEIPKADVWTGGFPCSDFSIMGKRKGLLGGNRSSLGLVFLDLVRRHRPPYVILENVPGILSSHQGRDFGLLLGALVDIGYGWSYRLLDARNFGLPQARRRVFVVAAADPADAGAVLDDATDRRVDAASLGGSRRAVVARGGDGAPGGPTFVLGPTYNPKSDAVVRTDGTAFPVLPSNKIYVLDETEPGADEPLVIKREGSRHLEVRRDGSTFTVTPAYGGWNGEQFVVDERPEPIVAQLATRRGPLLARADGSTYTLIPTEAQYVVDDGGEPITFHVGERAAGVNQGYAHPIRPPSGGAQRQWVAEVDRGPGPVVLAGVFPKRAEQRSPSRADGSSYTLTPGVIPYVLEDGDGWDLDGLVGGRVDVLDDRRGDGRRDGGGSGADVGTLAAALPDPEAPDGGVSVGPGPEADADGVRAAAGVSGWVDGTDGGSVGAMGPKHLDTARWHVLGRACPVPIVEWMGQALRTVIDQREGRV